MTLGRRISAGLCAFVLMAALVAFPLRARAMSSAAALTAVGGATVLAATLAACGIYPYAENQSFGEWGARALTDLLEQYNQAHVESALRMEQVRGYVVGKTVAIASATWQKLRSFVLWCRESFALADNQKGAALGVIVPDSGCLPLISSYPSLKNMIENGLHLSHWSYSSNSQQVERDVFAILKGDNPSVVAVAYQDVNRYYLFGSTSPLDSDDVVYYAKDDDYQYLNHSNKWDFEDGVYYWGISYGFWTDLYIPVFSSKSAALAYIRNYTVQPSISGVTVDTAVIENLPELPDDAEWGGLSVLPGTVTGVSDAGIGADAGTDNPALVDNPATVMTPQAVERIIQQGVEERQRPDVRPVEVEVGEGVTVDEETGELVAAEPGTVVITETDIPLSLGDYAIPSLSTVFPFSIPWDIMRIWQALDAEPRFPLQDFSMTLNVPLLFGDAPPTVRFSLDAFPEDVAAKMDDVALVVRYSLLLVACIGFLIFISQFIKF